MAESWTYPKVV